MVDSLLKTFEDMKSDVFQFKRTFMTQNHFASPLQTTLNPLYYRSVLIQGEGVSFFFFNFLSLPLLSCNLSLLLQDQGQNDVAAAVLYALDNFFVCCIDFQTLHREDSFSQEKAIAAILRESTQVSPSILYLPSIDQLWEHLSEESCMMLLRALDPSSPVPHFVLATTQDSFEIPRLSLLERISWYRCEISPPTLAQRKQFFQNFLSDIQIPPRRPKKATPLEKLEVVPNINLNSEPRKITVDDSKKEFYLAKLRLKLGLIIDEVWKSKKYSIFRKSLRDHLLRVGHMTEGIETQGVNDLLLRGEIQLPLSLQEIRDRLDEGRFTTPTRFLSAIRELVEGVKNFSEMCHNYSLGGIDTDGKGGAFSLVNRASSMKDFISVLMHENISKKLEVICETIEGPETRSSTPHRSARLRGEAPQFSDDPNELEILLKTSRAAKPRSKKRGGKEKKEEEKVDVEEEEGEDGKAEKKRGGEEEEKGNQEESESEEEEGQVVVDKARVSKIVKAISLQEGLSLRELMTIHTKFYFFVQKYSQVLDKSELLSQLETTLRLTGKK